MGLLHVHGPSACTWAFCMSVSGSTMQVTMGKMTTTKLAPMKMTTEKKTTEKKTTSRMRASGPLGLNFSFVRLEAQ